MKDIHIKVNLAVFITALFTWMAIGILIAITMYEPKLVVPDPLKNLFVTLTGMVLTMLTGFTKSTIPIDDNQPPPEEEQSKGETKNGTDTQ